MIDDDSTPEGTADDAPLSMAEAISAYTQTDSDSEEQPDTGEEESVEDTGSELDEDDEGEAEDTDDEDTADDEEDDESDEDEAGEAIASDDAKVTLDDGSTITVAELKRGHLRTGDYTRKTQELAEQRKAHEASQSTLMQQSQQLAQEREFIASLAQQLLPKAPDKSIMDTDPVGYMQAKAAYDESVNHLNQLSQQQQAAQQRFQAEQQQALAQHRKAEAERLLETMPDLKEPGKYSQFMTEAATVMQNHYGFSAEEVGEAMDHRFYPIFRDLAAYQRIKSGKGKAKQAVEGKPPVMRGGKRRGPGAQKAAARKAARDRLNKSGSLKDAVALYMMNDGDG